MNDIIKLDSIAKFNRERGQQTLHPLVTVLDNSKSTQVVPARFMSELYIVFLKEIVCGSLLYGRNNYDYEAGTLVFIAPGQLYGVADVKPVQPKGWSLAFHPDLIHGTALGKHIKDYNFFSYNVNESLHLSDAERQILMECLTKIQFELTHAIDKHSKTLITNNIELLLNYCERFYDRQFITREHIQKDILIKFEHLLDSYLASDKPKTFGLLSVAYCAE